MKHVDLMVFDFDGTLVDSKNDIVNSVNHVLRRCGLKEKDFAEVVSYIGTGSEELMQKALGPEGHAKFDKAYKLFREHYTEHMFDSSALYPHVKETLAHFGGKKTAIITNRHSSSARRMLEAFGIKNHFEHILGGEGDSCKKPSPCPVLEVISFFGVQPDKTMMVGDMDLDVTAGKEAGAVTCGVTYGIGSREDVERARPDFLIDNISKLKDLVL